MRESSGIGGAWQAPATQGLSPMLLEAVAHAESLLVWQCTKSALIDLCAPS